MIARSYGNLMSNLLRKSQLFIQVAVPFYFPTCNEGSSFSTHMPNFLNSFLIIAMLMAVSHGDFDLCFSKDS